MRPREQISRLLGAGSSQLCRVWKAAHRQWEQFEHWSERDSFRKRANGYWLKSFGAILVGVAVGQWLTEHDLGLPLRYEVSRFVQLLRPRQPALRTTVVLIGDDEFWKGPLARRLPIRRDYLATLVRKLARCDPSVIALDFKLRSPVLAGDLHDNYGTLRDNHAYIDETRQLAVTVEDVSKRTPIVLPISKSEDQKSVEPSVLDDVPETPGQLVRGNISLPWDYREVPTSETLGLRRVNSLALAAASILKPKLLARYPPEQDDPYDLAFIAPEDFPTVSYHETQEFPGAGDCALMRHQVVIVGGAWHTAGYRAGILDDLREHTPVGPVGAVYLHANYAEALLAERARGFIGNTFTVIVEIASAVVIALMLGANVVAAAPPDKKGSLLRRVVDFITRHSHLAKYVAAGAMAVLLLILTYVLAQNVNLYADFFFPGAFVFLHAWWHDWEELKAAELRLRQAEQELGGLRRSKALVEWL